MNRLFPGEYDHSDDIIDVEDLKLIRETNAAWHVTDGGVTVWLPKSLVKQIDGDTFRMPEWLANKEGLI